MLAKIAIIALYLLATGLLLLIRRLLIRPVNPTVKPQTRPSTKPAAKAHLKIIRRHHKDAIKLAAFIAILIHAAGSPSDAQQTIVDVSSGDGFDKGKVYAELDATFKFNNSPENVLQRFSVFVPRVVVSAQRAGGQFGVAQPLNSRLSLIADWYTGKPAAGYLTPGVIFKPHPKAIGYLDYAVGNIHVSRSNHFFLAEIGINLN